MNDNKQLPQKFTRSCLNLLSIKQNNTIQKTNNKGFSVKSKDQQDNYQHTTHLPSNSLTKIVTTTHIKKNKNTTQEKKPTHHS